MNIQLTKYSGATDDQISAAERDLKVSFPADYRAFVSRYDGASPEENVFRGDVNVSVDRFIPVSEIKRRASRVEGLPEDALPIADAPSGNLIYLRKSDLSVWYWDHELDAGEKELAKSFEEFLRGLESFDVESVQLKPGQVKSVWVDPDFKPEF